VVNPTANTFQLSTTNPSISTTLVNTTATGSKVVVHKWKAGVADAWDTIEDYNAGAASLPSTRVSGWAATTACGGVEAIAGDTNIWKDVTSNGCSSGHQCVMQDKASKLTWGGHVQPADLSGSSVTNASTTLTVTSTTGLSVGMYLTGTNILSGTTISAIPNGTIITMSAAATGTAAGVTVSFNQMPWHLAVSYCNNLTWDGLTGWRLPTQKELYAASEHGVRDATFTYPAWMTPVMSLNPFWSSTTVSYNGYMWVVTLNGGGTVNYQKQLNTSPVICVR